LIVARGGGSLEDLWGFNEEAVVRAAAECRIPLISAIGHETDVTLLDHVADLRAPTPTGAAEKAVPVRTELLAHLSERSGRRLRGMERFLARLRERSGQASRLLPRPDALIGDRRQRLDFASQSLSRGLLDRIARHRRTAAEANARLRPATMRARLRMAEQELRAATTRLSPLRLSRAVAERRERVGAGGVALTRAGQGILTARKTNLSALTRTIEALSYRRVLDRGFAVVRDAKGRIVSAPGDVVSGDALSIEFGTPDRLDAIVGKGAKTARARVTKQPQWKEDLPDLFDDL